VYHSFFKFQFSQKAVGPVHPIGSYHTIKRSDTMTYENNFTLPAELLEQIAANCHPGIDFIPDLNRIVVNAAMKTQPQQYLDAAPNRLTSDRQDHTNGFKPKTVSSADTQSRGWMGESSKVENKGHKCQMTVKHEVNEHRIVV